MLARNYCIKISLLVWISVKELFIFYNTIENKKNLAICLTEHYNAFIFLWKLTFSFFYFNCFLAALDAVAINIEENGIKPEKICFKWQDLISQGRSSDWDVVLVGDILYDEGFAGLAMEWLVRAKEKWGRGKDFRPPELF